MHPRDMPQTALAESLVQTHILGFRKGTTDVPNWTHSFRVRDILVSHGFSDEVCLAGLLHDIVEDGNVSLQRLKDEGFSDRVVELVDLCSHDNELVGGEVRWVNMMARLARVGDADAWAIKMADLTDNLRSCHTMSEDRQRFMRETKRPLVLALTHELLGGHPLWNELDKATQ